jgi:site-specific recombinase XerD
MDYINQFILEKKKELNDRSRIEYERDLRQLETYCNKTRQDILTVTKLELSKYVSTINVSNRTTNRKIAVFRSFYLWLEDQGYNNPAKGIRSVKVSSLYPDSLNEIELNLVLADEVIKPMIHTLYYTGLRVSELVGANINDVNFDKLTIDIIGKGSKERTVLFTKGLSDILNGYRLLLSENPEPLFISEKTNARLTISEVEQMFRKLSRRVGFHVHPHRMRHTFASNALSMGMTLVEVKDLLGHSNISTTSIYVHTTERLFSSYKTAFGGNNGIQK